MDGAPWFVLETILQMMDARDWLCMARVNRRLRTVIRHLFFGLPAKERIDLRAAWFHLPPTNSPFHGEVFQAARDAQIHCLRHLTEQCCLDSSFFPRRFGSFGSSRCAFMKELCGAGHTHILHHLRTRLGLRPVDVMGEAFEEAFLHDRLDTVRYITTHFAITPEYIDKRGKFFFARLLEKNGRAISPVVTHLREVFGIKP